MTAAAAAARTALFVIYAMAGGPLVQTPLYLAPNQELAEMLLPPFATGGTDQVRIYAVAPLEGLDRSAVRAMWASAEAAYARA